MMKKLPVLLSALLISALAFGQQPTLTITLDAANTMTLSGTNCDSTMEGAENVYIHSGAGTAAGSYWSFVLGNWGMDDGVGQMTDNGDGTFSIDIDLNTYYADAGYDPVAEGEVVTLGFVFRDADGSREGKMGNCDEDYSIADVTADPIEVVGITTGSTADNVTATSGGTTGLSEFGNSIGMVQYPNPIITGSIFKYTLEDAARVRLSVHNSLGQEIAVVADEVQNAGSQKIIWQAADLQPGVYTYQLNVEGQIAGGTLIKH